MSERKPHKHAAVIKAWADGAVVQWFNPETTIWTDCLSPEFRKHEQYRIKPEPVTVERWVALYEDGSFSAAHYESEVACRACAPMFSTTRVVKLTGTCEE